MLSLVTLPPFTLVQGIQASGFPYRPFGAGWLFQDDIGLVRAMSP
jgi:hypothetical protein